MRLSDDQVQRKMNDIGEPRVKRPAPVARNGGRSLRRRVNRMPWNPRAAPTRERATVAGYPFSTC